MIKLTAPITATLVVLFASLLSCKHTPAAEDYSGYSEKHIQLAGLDKNLQWKDSIASIIIQVPQRLDTFYQWHRTSDCITCGRLQYRFADHHYSQFAESGEDWTATPDSVFQLTFMHDPVIARRKKELKKLVPADTTALPQYLANSATSCDKFAFLYRKIERIHGRTFVLTAFTSNCSITSSEKPSLFVGAITPLKDMSLMILAENSSQDTTGFIDMVNKSIRSLEIQEPK